MFSRRLLGKGLEGALSMGTIKGELSKAGFSLSADEKRQVKTSLTNLRRKKKQSFCRKCGAQIKFILVDAKALPHDLDEKPHWRLVLTMSFLRERVP